MEALKYAVVGKPFAKIRTDHGRVKVKKKAHILVAGRTLCQTENGYRKPPQMRIVEEPPRNQRCFLCQKLLEQHNAAQAGVATLAEPSLAVLLGERVDLD